MDFQDCRLSSLGLMSLKVSDVRDQSFEALGCGCGRQPGRVKLRYGAFDSGFGAGMFILSLRSGELCAVFSFPST